MSSENFCLFCTVPVAAATARSHLREANKGAKTENHCINLKVACQDGSVVQFKIRRHTLLRKLEDLLGKAGFGNEAD